MARRKKAKPDKVRSRTRIVDGMAVVIVRDFRNGTAPSLFYYEGAFIAQMRADLCLIGWPWPVADQTSRDIVGEALRKARAKRPAWHEGQRAFAQNNVTRGSGCRQCDLPLKAQQVSFCSSNCCQRWWRAFNREAA